MVVTKKNLLGALLSILLAEAVGFLAGLLSGNSRAIYQSLTQPPLSPPGWIFPIVWTILYALMGLAAYLIYASACSDETKKRALGLYLAQLGVNFLWSIVFFTFGAYGAALVVLLLLDYLVFMTIRAFREIRPVAAWLLIPYFLWILFATYLNVGIVALN